MEGYGGSLLLEVSSNSTFWRCCREDTPASHRKWLDQIALRGLPRHSSVSLGLPAHNRDAHLQGSEGCLGGFFACVVDKGTEPPGKSANRVNGPKPVQRTLQG